VTGSTTATSRSSATNSTLIDSDNDGMPDSIEWQLGTQPSSQDLDEDPDNGRARRPQRAPLPHQPSAAGHRHPRGERVPVRSGGGRSGRRAGRQCYRSGWRTCRWSPTLPNRPDGGITLPDGGQFFSPMAGCSSLTGAPATVRAGTRSRSRSPCSALTTRQAAPSSAPSTPPPRATRWVGSSRRWTGSSASSRRLHSHLLRPAEHRRRESTAARTPGPERQG
jgi:hypothetical protein